MNLLMVSPYYPCFDTGACIRSYHLLKALSQQYTVSLIVYAADDEAKEASLEDMRLQNVIKVPLPVYLKYIKYRRVHQLWCMLRGKSHLLEAHHIEGVQQALDVILKREHYDIILFEGAHVTADYRVPSRAKIIIDQHNIEFELLHRTYLHENSFIRKWFSWWESHRVRPIELRRCAKADGVLVTSDREASLLKSFLPQTKIAIVPNGVDIGAFRLADRTQEIPGRIIFTGSMEYYPNIDAVLYFARDCWPFVRSKIPDATWHIVGRDPPRSVLALGKLPGISVTGTVPDIRPYLGSATLAIAPLFIGSGTRLKILEALAAGKPVVSTSMGCEGLPVVSGRHLIVADRPEMFAQSVVDLLRNAKRRAALGRAGRALAETCSWEFCGSAAIRAIEEMAQPRAAPQNDC